MDVYEEIEFELWCEKKAKECQTLTPYTIAQSFEEEALEIIPRINRILKRKLLPLREKIMSLHEQARFKKWDEFTLDFYIQCAIILDSKSDSNIHKMERNNLILSLAKRRKTIIDNPKQNPVNIDTIAQAKQMPILSLYSFDKQRKLGQKVQACCPFHGERTASFFIYANNTFHCFGCSANGSAIDFYMKLNNCDFKHAVRALAGV